MSNPRIHQAVADAVNLVNHHRGVTSVKLLFNDDPTAVDIVANSARIFGDTFEFVAGFESYGGSFSELRGIEARVIQH
jgi:hypothetical protein